MPFHYTKIDDITFNGSPLYFRTPINNNMTRATIFSDKYIYFHTPSILHNNASDIKCLGKFVKMNIRNKNNSDDFIQFYEFESGTVDCNKNGKTDGELYLIGIPDSGENMIQLDHILYRDWPVFYTI
uniref:Uncharacterized protein n=1 Tax=viral metagenome TaxID=1070528 RepID=A0A6C0IFJ4_9ZZZZ